MSNFSGKNNKCVVSTARPLALALALLIGCGSLLTACSGKSSQANEAPAKRNAEVVPALVAKVMKRDMALRIDGIGNVEVHASVAIKSRVDGEIIKMLFADGDDVVKDQTLFQIDARPYVAELKQAEAALQKDKAQLEHAHSQERRYQDLLRKNFVSQEGYAQVKLNLDSAAAALQADQAAVDNAKLRLGYATIRAPIAGHAGKILVQEGNLVKANDASPLVIINQLSPIYVNFSVPEQHLPEIRKAMAAGKLAVDALQPDGASIASGQLSFLDNAVDTATATIKLKATFDNIDKALWPGQFVKVRLILGEQKQAVVVASRAVLTGPKGQYVFVVDPEQKVEARVIEVDRIDGADTVVRNGLAGGETVVIDGQSRLLPGSKISVKDEKKTS